LFDLKLRFLSSTTEPYAFTLLYNGKPLDLSGTNSDGKLLAAAHVGGITDCSEWLGDSATSGPGTTTTGLCGSDPRVPEPASMLLFGLGTIGVAARMRRRFSL
jgi:hypothetical protein